MIQEIIALIIFSAAVIYTVIAIIRLIIPSKNKVSQACGSNMCSCNGIKENDLLRYKSNRRKNALNKNSYLK